MELYRCARLAEFKGLNLPRVTRRLPGNVPYVVDNIWEWLRPPEMPCRRHSIFASPSITTARESASKWGGDELKVGLVCFVGRRTVGQCLPTDAKLSSDVRSLPDVLLKYLGPDWFETPAAARGSLGALFQPVITREDVANALLTHPLLSARLRDVSCFWREAKLVHEGKPSPFADGEVFFEALDGYELHPKMPKS